MTIQVVIDGTGAILGRLASFVAKQALYGKQVIVVNCSDVLISGDRQMILKQYLRARRRGRGSQKGPYFPKIPERLVKRTVRGMLQYTKQKGWDAFKRIRCYDSLPKEFEAAAKIKLARPARTKVTKLSELAKLL